MGEVYVRYDVVMTWCMMWRDGCCGCCRCWCWMTVTNDNEMAVNYRLLSLVQLLVMMFVVVSDGHVNLYMNSTETKRLLGLISCLVYNTALLFTLLYWATTCSVSHKWIGAGCVLQRLTPLSFQQPGSLRLVIVPSRSPAVAYGTVCQLTSRPQQLCLFFVLV